MDYNKIGVIGTYMGGM